MSRVAALLESMQRRGTAPCLFEGGREWTYAQLVESIARWRRRVREMPSTPGFTVGLQGDFGLEPVGLLFALLAEGRTVTMVPRDGNARDHLAEACVERLLVIADDGALDEQVREGTSAHPLLTDMAARGEAGIVIFTSGSSGKPKAALHATERLLSKFDRPGRPFRTLAFLLFDHVAGLDTLLYTLSAGGTLVTLRRRDVASVLQTLEDGRVEVLPTSPSFLRLLCAAGTDGFDLSSLKIITYGSEPMDQTTLDLVNERFPGCQIQQKYGTTETGSPRTESRDNGSLWIRFKDDGRGARFEVRDGVLWTRGETTFLGYLNAPSPVDADGWYCTGDLVEQDGPWLRFRGRASEVINVGGEKVAPSEVENTILELDFVASVVVSGEPNAILGNIVTARVTLVDGAALQAKDAIAAIRRHCRARLAGYKVPVKVTLGEENALTARQKRARQPGAATP
jgi:long-chain acyl-CoA synthetase